MIWVSARRLDWALRTRGTDLSSWPSAERAAALCLMRRCARARAVMADALADEAARADEAAPLADAAVLARMQGRLRTCMVAQRSESPAIRWGALAACAVGGLYLGIALEQDASPDLFSPDLVTYVMAAAIDSAS